MVFQKKVKIYLTIAGIGLGCAALILLNQCTMAEKQGWKAIVAFNNSESISEDWSWFYGDIIEACQGKGIYVLHVQDGQSKVSIGPKIEPVAVVDITSFLDDHEMGYLFIAEGQKIKYQEYNMPDIVLEKASEYFGISNLIDESMNNDQKKRGIDENR